MNAIDAVIEKWKRAGVPLNPPAEPSALLSRAPGK